MCIFFYNFGTLIILNFLLMLIDVSSFTPWTFFTDMGIISLLILVGKLIRVKVKLIQKLFIPPSLIAGALGLAFGPNGVGWLPLSGSLGSYASVLIALVFGALPLSSSNVKFKEVAGRVGPMWAYAQIGLLFQWALAGLFGLLVLKLIWPSLNDAFGTMLATGFYGGHGTAAAIGAAFNGLGWDEAESLGMTTATVGIICAIVFGLVFIKWAAAHKHTAFITDFKDLPDDLRSGLIPEGKRKSMGSATTSSISIEPLTFHIALIFAIALGGYLISVAVKQYYPKLELPVFSCAFIVGLLFKQCFVKLKVSSYICQDTTSRLSSMFTDLLVAFGVSAIKLSVVVKYAVPLIVLMLFGIIIVFLITFVFGRLYSRTYWFERSIFAWGWWTGTMAMGIALLRIVDPEGRSKAMDDYALAYLPVAPVEILVITFVPIMFTNGLGLWMSLICLALTAVTVLISWKLGWLKISPEQHEYMK